MDSVLVGNGHSSLNREDCKHSLETNIQDERYNEEKQNYLDITSITFD